MTLRLGSFSTTAACLLLTGGTLLAHDPHDPIQAVAISPNFAQDQTLLAATAGLTVKLGAIVLLKSTDGGADWSPVSGLQGNSTIKAVVFSPAYGQDHTVFVAGGTGLSVSTDGANTWTLLSATPLVDLALSPNFATDNTLYALGNTSKVYRSVNRGVKFTPVTAPGPLTAGLNTIAVSPNFATDHSLLIGSQVNGIFKSFNGGGTWTAVTAGSTLSNVTALNYAPDFNSTQTVFAGIHGSGVLISTDGGNTWAKSNAGLTELNVISLAFSPTYAQDGTLWVTTAVKGVFQSTSRGASWGRPVTVSRQLSNLTTVHYQTFAATAGLQLLGMFEGLWTSVNNGASWQYVDTVPTRMVRYIHPSPNYAHDHTVFVSTYGSGNLWSTDGGATWAARNTGMSAPYVDGSAISPDFAADGMAFGGTHVGLDRTSNGGGSWKLMPGPGVAAYPRGLAVSPNFVLDSTVFIGTTSASGHNGPVPNTNATPGLYISTNQGQTWTLSSLSGIGVVSIAFSPAFATDKTAFAATQSNGIYETNDGGLTWTTVTFSGGNSMAQVAVSPAFATDGVVLASTTKGGIYKSSNGGATWTELANTGNVRTLDMQFSPNYAVDQTLFIGTTQNGVMVSTNGGATLSQSSFPDVFASAVGVSPNFTNDGTVFAAGYHGLFKSTDGGATWTYLPSPARIEESRCITSLLQEPPTIVYQGAWQVVSAAAASTDQYALTIEPQDTALLSFNGSGVRWISWTGPAQGSASIALDGVTLGNVSLTGSTNLLQQVVWEQHGLACGNHTFTITASPLLTQSVTLDAFDVWIDQCPFTNNNSASLGTTSLNTDSAAGNGSVSLTAIGPWTAASDAPWLSISPGSASGSGNALIQFSFDANTSTSPRIGTLTIAGLTFMISQAGN